MRTWLFIMLLFGAAAGTLFAHQHAEVYLGAGNKLAIEAPQEGFATFFPLGEIPSGNLPEFPGGHFACELTFSAFETTALPPAGATVRIEILSVTGPQGGSFSFWETDATSPTITRSSGWTAGAGDTPSFFVSEDGSGYGHIHGRVFTVNKSGSYEVAFRAADVSGAYATSDVHTFRFNAIRPPALTVVINGGDVRLTFTGRPGLVYDVQTSTTLAAEDWETIGDPLDGEGAPLQFSDPIQGRLRAFYRLVEYQ